MYLVMDMVQGQSITQMLEPSAEGGYDNERNNENLKKPKTTKFTEDEAKYIFMQLLDVIDYLGCEEIGICHRDVNPNNIMLDAITEFEQSENEGPIENKCTDFKENTKRLPGGNDADKSQLI